MGIIHYTPQLSFESLKPYDIHPHFFSGSYRFVAPKQLKPRPSLSHSADRDLPHLLDAGYHRISPRIVAALLLGATVFFAESPIFQLRSMVSGSAIAIQEGVRGEASIRFGPSRKYALTVLKSCVGTVGCPWSAPFFLSLRTGGNSLTPKCPDLSTFKTLSHKPLHLDFETI